MFAFPDLNVSYGTGCWSILFDRVKGRDQERNGSIRLWRTDQAFDYFMPTAAGIGLLVLQRIVSLACVDETSMRA